MKTYQHIYSVSNENADNRITCVWKKLPQIDKKENSMQENINSSYLEVVKLEIHFIFFTVS